MPIARSVAVLAALLAIAGCSRETASQPDADPTSPGTALEPSTGVPETGTGTPTESDSEDPDSEEPDPEETEPAEPVDPTEAVGAADLDLQIAVGAVRRLAGVIGPREATGASYDRAARWVARSLAEMDYEVARQRVDVPAGESWGTPVAAGRSANVVATPPGFDPTEPHLVVGAHLDTVAGTPGAEDNASGVGVMLAVAQAVAQRRTRLPVVFVAFGAEEPRGPGDDDHHYGSRRFVAMLTPEERAALRAMVSLDRVGVGASVPIGSAGESDPVQRSLLAAAARLGVPATPDPGQRSSDHWSFVRDGLPGARLGSTPYAGYHSPADLPEVVQPAQLDRVGRIVLEWLAPR